MANDAIFRSALVWLAAIVVSVGVYTHSFKKMMATYAFGMFAIAGVLLPDWEFFNREVSRWCFPVTTDEISSASAQGSIWKRFGIYPVRLFVYTSVYAFGLYKWWIFVSN